MGQTGNERVLWAIRLILGLPLLVICFYVLLFSNDLVLDITVLTIMTIIIAFLISRARVLESFSNYQHTEHHVKEEIVQQDVFTIPVVCPVCKTALKLDEVTWKDQQILWCQECHSQIDVTVT